MPALGIVALLRGKGNGEPDDCSVHSMEHISVASEKWAIEVKVLSNNGFPLLGHGDGGLRLLFVCTYLVRVVAILFER